MNEERAIAEGTGTESPVWDTIEQTHNCFDQAMELVLTQMKATDRIVIASHNSASIELCKQILHENSLNKH